VQKADAKAGTFRLHQRPEPESPWSRMSGGPEPCISKAREVNGPRSETRILLLILRLGNDRFNLDQFHQWLTPQVRVDDAGQCLGVAEIDCVGGIDMTYDVHIGR
jgi:hypothetical protein